MKFYLSSYRIGDEAWKLRQLLSEGKVVGFIPNAMDSNVTDIVNMVSRQESIERDIKELEDSGIQVEMLDLKEFFGKSKELEEKVNKLDGLWVRGGNTFVLRQAMKLSGLDRILKNIERNDFVYGGYSAGICVLAPDFKALDMVDDSTLTPYKESKEVIWTGLGLLDYIILPHYKSNHPESADIDKEVEFCKRNNIRFKTLRDGEVIIIE